MKHTFGALGPQLQSLGYDVLPLSGKRPITDGWESVVVDADRARRYAAKYANNNIGIQTRHTPAIDIDVYDAEMAEALESWCLDNLGDAPVRVGQAPKRLLVYRTDEPFSKMFRDYVDGDGKRHRVEVLGNGQQFAAFGTHPDTRKPFEWVSIDTPLDIDAALLTTVTRESASRVLDEFSRLAELRGWMLKGAKHSHDDFDDDDDALLSVKPAVEDLDLEDIRDAVMLVQGADEYDRWIDVGLALYHQFHGEQDGLDIWQEWSATAHNYDADAVEYRWSKFSETANSGRSITFRSIIEWAKEGAKVKAKDEFAKARNIIASCTDVDDLFTSVVPKLAKSIMHDYQVEAIAKDVQAKAQAIDGVKRPMALVRKQITAALKSGVKSVERLAKPEWLEGWVWMENADRFYNLNEHADISTRSFNARYDMHMLTAEDKALGRAIPEQRAADVALNLYDIPKVRKPIYLPGYEKLLDFAGDLCLNLYDEREVPKPRPPKTPAEHEALRTVQRHFEVLFPNQRERELVISFCAYQVQCPAERIRWAVLIQGVEGAGKTWFHDLMGVVLGSRNVAPVKPESLFADFNGWAEGRKMLFVEEIRVTGQSRFAVLNKIKPNITNAVLEITKKGRDPYQSPNVSSYMLFSNFADALPLSTNDRRYMVLRTALQTKRQMVKFLADNPGYFDDLFAATHENPEVLRGWLMGWKMHPDFNPRGHAPVTEAFEHMRDAGSDDEEDAISDIVESGQFVDCTEYLLNLSTLTDKLIDKGVGVPKTRALRHTLDSMGFVFLGRFRVGQEKHRFYTQTPELFEGGKAAVAALVRDILSGEVDPALM